MAFQWLSERLGLDRTFSDLSKLIVTLNESTQEQLQEQKKGLRRLSLAQKQQSDSISALSRQIELMGEHSKPVEGTLYPNDRLLELLDSLRRIELASQNSDMAASLAQKAAADVVDVCHWQAVAWPNQPYPEEGCEVVGAIPASDQPPGTVKEVIQQGYKNAQNQLIRTAKVVVHQKPQTTELQNDD